MSEPERPERRTRQPGVREIHKNAWLKRLGSSTDKKGFLKRIDRLWVVFCVHDDSEPFLEFYTEPKMGAIHKPMAAISLNSCLHVSPSILGQENKEYQFVVTLPSQVIRLIAANWEQMIEWVESLQGKLREMNIICPKDNLYSKLPENNKVQACSTRDPNSPLPPPPNRPPDRVNVPSRLISSRGAGSEDTTVVTAVRPLSAAASVPNAEAERQASMSSSSSSASSTSVGVSQQIRRSVSSENMYEHLFIPPARERNPPPRKPTRVPRLRINVSGGDGGGGDGVQGTSDESPPPLIPRRHPAAKRLQRSGQRSSSLSRLEESSRDPASNPTFFHQTSSLLPNLQGNPLEGMIGVRSGEYRIRRDEGHMDSHVPLKEQQVLRLQTEINHPGGVRIVLRKKDSLNTIAFIDYLGAVWIGGWKQRQHPVLYYAFHVGDQVLKVAGVTVHSSLEANRAIRMVSSMQVEFIIRRLPYGQVYVIKRSVEAEPLGLVAEGHSGEISEVLESGLAFSQGLPAKGPGMDGSSATSNWYLTEINNRPLSLISRDNEVKERLNAVGKEISILVQPAELVKHLRKGLKSLKGFKDYLVG